MHTCDAIAVFRRHITSIETEENKQFNQFEDCTDGHAEIESKNTARVSNQ